MQRKTRLDVHQIQAVNLGMFRSAFDRIVELSGFQMQPGDNTGCVWNFQHPESGERGRLLHVEGYLGKGGINISVNGMAYLITRQHFTLALAFPSAPRTMWLTDSNHKVLPNGGEKQFPAEWPKEMIKRVIRSRFRKVVIIDESYLLQKIGLRTPASLR